MLSSSFSQKLSWLTMKSADTTTGVRLAREGSWFQKTIFILSLFFSRSCWLGLRGADIGLAVFCFWAVLAALDVLEGGLLGMKLLILTSLAERSLMVLDLEMTEKCYWEGR